MNRIFIEYCKIFIQILVYSLLFHFHFQVRSSPEELDFVGIALLF